MGAVQRLSDGFARLYFYIMFSTILARYPWWLLTSLLPALRPRKSWSIRKSVNLKFLHFLFNSIGRKQLKSRNTLPNHRELRLDNGVQGVYVSGVPELVTGKVKEWAAEAHVESIRIPGYWIHKKGQTIVMGQPPIDGEKVVYFLHGGAYSYLSAHPSSPTSNVPRGLLKCVQSVKRSFAIEYRLSSASGDPIEGEFPSALVDAIAGYSYLVNSVGFSPEDIVLVGDSAGGNLAQALTRYLAEYGGSVPGLPGVPGALVLLSPWADMSGSHYSPGSSVFTNKKSDIITGINEPYLIDAPRSFIAPFGLEFPFNTPYLSPACKKLEDVSFAGFPRVFLASGDAEVLLDQIRTFRDRITAQLGEDKVTYYEAKDAFHDCICIMWSGPERLDTLKAIAEFVDGAK
ncbi:alpha/beta-hydrolase [Phellopilus nigrolimitatus]|nr:alpha/beta-hydrolase [Phellopilus nigrolimitatus]